MTDIKLPQELLDFYEGLESIIKEHGALVALPELEISGSDLEKHYSLGNPLFSLVPLKLETDLCAKVFMDLCKLISDKKPTTGDQIQALSKLDKVTVERLVMEYISGEKKLIEEIIAEHSLSPVTMDFLLENTAKPFLRAYANLVGSVNRDEDWQRSHCPVCGNKAHYARINEEDNKRYLQCSLCEHQWLYKRLACPNCANEDHKSLRTLLIENTPKYQLHVCEQCKTYLKVFDSRQGIPEKATLKDAATVFLDIIAQQQGYISNSFTS